jgi:RHS repeat-associated protein
LTSAGAVQKHIRHHSFGRITQQTGTLSNRFWYTGREWDGEIGLYFYRARYYDPLVGRFVGEDPIGFEARDANLYRYVLNSSPNATDPMGLFVPPPAPVLPGIGLLRPLLRTLPFLYTPGGGGLLNPWRTNPYEFPRDLPRDKPKSCPAPEMPQRRKRCDFVWETPPTPNSAFRICAYDCKGYGGIATFPWPKDLPCPKSFDDLFPNIPPGYPDPNLSGM